ncbi:Subtilisin-like protease SBT1.8 [Dichanthelium oligosanthes]|uniref:Subtilisin-like protease SBT1.8 n=1 Tax=Dichanthelium oligosanthes TaxID=888268 RepID=A0A1E5V2T2_9POAL|nr:Subtilisin-like protease SBT1.8 [Dichanthelium oligosanthes]
MELTLPLILLVASLSFADANSDGGNTMTYIVFMDPAQMPAVHASPAHWHAVHLESLSIDPARHLLYSYSAAAHGFAAALLPDHLPLLRGSPEVLQVVQDEVFQLHTTRSPEFLGLLTPAYQPAIGNLEAATHDVVIGVLDTGVWPESPSFAGGSLPPPPARWKGVCEAGVDFPPSACGRKLVGARSFSRGLRAANGGAIGMGKTTFRSARDRDGHGTHTASTAAGAVVANASLLGYATGTARGMAPGARVAAYKVCWPEGCLGSDILAGIDAAVADGVGVLSLSLGGGAAPYFRDTVAVGAFGAAAAGVFVSCSAGNSGPSGATVSNSAPWVATVGAGTLDRDFPAYVTLSTGARLAGVSLYAGPSPSPRPAMLPLVYGSGRDNASKLCLTGTLDPAAVRGKIVLCDRGVNARVEKGAVVKAAGGAGMVLANTAASGEELVADSHLLPAVAVGRTVGDKIREYAAHGGGRPMAMLSFGGTVLGVRPSPVVAAFSSRGPNTVVPEILKPDMIGPGVNILAGWSGVAGPTGLAKDGRRTNFNIISGTSMSCPHISGVAALLKAAHPNWSPAAIKSALMTTAYTVDNTNSSLQDAADGSLSNAFAYGAGHVDPQKALSPGLVYDISTNDYVAFLCSLNYSGPHIQVITKMSNISCPKKFRPGDLNYPSFSVVFNQKSKRIMRFRRELTNVGPAMSVYNVKVSSPESVRVTVTPTKLTFKKVGQKQRYYVTFMSKAGQGPTKPDFGWVSWVNDEHVVRSPVAYTWKM